MYTLDLSGKDSKVGPQDCGQELRTCGDTQPPRRCWQISEIQKPPFRKGVCTTGQGPKKKAGQAGETSAGVSRQRDHI